MDGMGQDTFGHHHGGKDALEGILSQVHPVLKHVFFQNNHGWVGFFSKLLNYITSNTPPKSNIDTNNDGLEPPFKHGYFGYLC